MNTPKPALIPENVVEVSGAELPALAQRLAKEGKFISLTEVLRTGYRCTILELPNPKQPELLAMP